MVVCVCVGGGHGAVAGTRSHGVSSPPQEMPCKCKTGCGNRKTGCGNRCGCNTQGKACLATCKCTACENPLGKRPSGGEALPVQTRRMGPVHVDKVDGSEDDDDAGAAGGGGGAGGIKGGSPGKARVKPEREAAAVHETNVVVMASRPLLQWAEIESLEIKGVFYVGSTKKRNLPNTVDRHSKDKFGVLDYHEVRNMKKAEDDLIEHFGGLGPDSPLGNKNKSGQQKERGYVYVIHSGNYVRKELERLQALVRRHGLERVEGLHTEGRSAKPL